MKYLSDKAASFADTAALKGEKEIGDKVNKIIAGLAEANDLKGVIDQADFNDEGKGFGTRRGSAEPQLGTRRGSAEPQPGMRRGSAEPQLGTDQARPGLGAPKGWYSRGYLPHLDSPAVLQSVTFRLADSLPREKLRALERKLAAMPETERDQARRRAIDAWLDAGMGCCALSHPRLAAVMQETLLRFDGARYRLLAWCVMPNHVHVLIDPDASLPKIVQSWKSYTGRWALAHNVELRLGVPGPNFWMRDYWDRYIRDQRHLDAVLAYIHQNPVKAGLCGRPEGWPRSSAVRIAELGLGAPGASCGGSAAPAKALGDPGGTG